MFRLKAGRAMGETSLYETDIYAWAEQQAEALRRLSGRPGLPNGLDLANVVEEVADVGISELRTVESLLENILSHLVLAAADAEAPSVRHWLSEVIAWQSSLRRRITPAMRRRIDLDQVWRDAVHTAVARLDIAGQTVIAVGVRPRWASVPCPLTLDQLADPAFSVRDAVGRLAPEPPPG